MAFIEEVKKGIACDSVGKPNSLVGRTVCVAAHPGKMALFPFVHWFEKHYRGKYKFARLVFGVDLVLIGLLLGLSVTAAILWLIHPPQFTDKIYMEATVAPRDIVAGAPSTLVIHYTNGTNETIDNAVLNLGFPDHFLLQAVTEETETGDEAAGEAINLGTLAPGASGNIKIRGVMFGDVGGKQTFRSILTFARPSTKQTLEKTSYYTFSPVRSTLQLSLALPEKLVAGQMTDGTITYKNAGEIDFPEISIAPTWPDGFTLLSSDVPLKDGVFTLPAIKAGEEGVFHFDGRLGDVSGDVPFTFVPSFTFGETRYTQETLTQTSPVIPLPLRVSHSADGALRPGTNAAFTVQYENIGETPLTNVTLGIESASPFVRAGTYQVDAKTHPELASIAPGATGTVTVTVPLRSSIQQSETTVYEHIQVPSQVVATYGMDGVTVTSRDAQISSTLTSPLVIDSFARYTASTGDQLGRGPLPPLVGEETKYWVFWNIRGTTNTLSNVQIEGTLGPGVRFTGRQTVSQNNGVQYDPTTNSISWTANTVSPTLAPNSTILGIAFEVGVTPTLSQVGTTPTLISSVRATGTDTVTGEFVSASGASASTNIPNDPMAGGNGVVEP
jgi:hypothetical protein